MEKAMASLPVQAPGRKLPETFHIAILGTRYGIPQARKDEHVNDRWIAREEKCLRTTGLIRLFADNFRSLPSLPFIFPIMRATSHQVDKLCMLRHESNHRPNNKKLRIL